MPEDGDMKSWIRALAVERKLFDSIKTCVGARLDLLDLLFDPNIPKLSARPEQLLLEARGLCSSDYFLVKLAIELWTGNVDRPVSISQILDQEPEVFNNIMRGLQHLRAPSQPLELQSPSGV
jgi:hypothetical protein